ncbi:two-partner secretion domain-containing protein [Allocoleopsis franciscana]|uniref:Filamentous hemagglutinin family N-terminal domain protein n=1 Tax=Allocoleopsis franciscana PCC 7113 TaxID=1173027 RepID=K9WDL9_9CYAN|nr:filamentous hemagglutinin N-terminal domain-containing protein [Allocoleopsis franciscana]AFZ17854.1 filamentous hemagglutinin family N-terminal domain protein [Allocoleopsis franciscana PCC 7113]
MVALISGMLWMVTYFPGDFGLGLIRVLKVGGVITLRGCCAISFAGAPWAIAFAGNPALAQITPDTMLGTESSVVTPNINIRGLPGDRIDGGAVRGANLFHSFQEFNVGEGQRVYFANPTGIENILSRITGNNLSNILGTLGVDGGANLFLLNPNGIIFGAGAKLDISGSFLASTANSVVFNNGYQFSATNPEAPPLLTVSVPLGVQYGSNQPRATITNSGILAVGQNFTLNAGNLDLQGLVQAGKDLTLQAQDTVKIRDSAINPFIAAAGNQLLVQGNETVDIFALNHANSGFFSSGDMVLRSPNSVMGDAHYTTGGNFRIERLDGSLGNLWSPGDPVIRATGNVSFTNYTGASLHIFAGGSVNITGRVTITGIDATNFINETVTLSDQTTELSVNGSTRPTLDIRAGTLAVGNPVNVCVGCPLFQPTSLTFLNTPLTADITINEIVINRPDGLVFLTNQYQPNSALAGNIQVTGIFADDSNGSFIGKGSDVVIDSRGNITLPEDGRIQTNSGTGNAGNVTLFANGSFFMNPGSQIQAVTFGQGNSGNVTIKVGDAVINSGIGTVIYTNVGSDTGANAGDINIQAGSLSLIDGAQLQAIGGQGNAGNVIINVRDDVLISGADSSGEYNSSIYTSIGEGATGNGGNIEIEAGTLTLTDYGFLDAGAFSVDGGVSSQGQSQAGNIILNVRDTITVAGFNAISGYPSGMSVGTYAGASGQAGRITINTDKLRVADGAYLSASTYNSSNGGEITVNANIVELTGGGQILALPYAQGNGGNVTLNVSDRLTISGYDPTFQSRLIEFGSGVVINQGNVSGVFTGYGLGVLPTFLNIPVESTGNAGNISIIGPREVNIDQGELFTGAFNTGNAGTLSITQTGSVRLTNLASMSTSTFGTGNAGTLLIETGNLSVQNQSFIISATVGDGDAGDLTIRANDSVEVNSGSRITSQTSGSGNAADLTVETRRLSLRNGEISSGAGTRITTDGDFLIFSQSNGRSGNLTIKALESVDIGGEPGTPIGGLFTATFGYGQGGDLSVETGRLTIQDGGRIEAGTFGNGLGGTVRINALESIELIGTSADGTFASGVSAYSRPPLDFDANLWQGNANSGGVNLTTNQLIIRDGAEVTTAVEGASQTGNAGDIQVQANSLSLTNGGRITSRSDGVSNAGNINVNVTGNLRSSGGTISATSTQLGGGNINIAADDIRLDGNSLISTSVKESTGGGGNITINSTVFLAIEDSDILANAADGRGGDIFINSEAFLADIFSRRLAEPVGRNPGDFARFRNNDRVDISADSKAGQSGTVTYPDIEQIRGVPALPSNLVDAEGLIDRRCTPNNDARKSSFTITGRGGLPPSPSDPLMNDEVWVDWISLEEREENGNAAATETHSTSSNPKSLVEAQGWIINEKGQVVLTAQAPTVTPNRPQLELPPCEENEAAFDQ